ncbi:HECT-type E3 ubiquitin transferase [Caenorhabditis elegans]|uniref:HECT-type E3 ubiquitin transferase n=1 Tax=Caenorhabditis elegans TaxID=6239 RepID=U4PES6_CAEEL|nr:HECT-type E3 ubiquitin transferase [Caenorhabditis elegans]CDH93242.1 HECT-type E3 ubiquitin transferase [Caenorhabditis elegans]|eukprot:NP_001294470.1 Enhancer of EfL-1 mutant phenotype [Caenorhabditis elegans]
MKIDDAEPSSSSSGSDMPPASATLLRNIVATKNDEDFIAAINKGREVHAVMGKTELYKWTEVLNRCDEILEKAVHKNEFGNLQCDHDTVLKNHAVAIVRFTVLLFECTSSRRIYKSVDRILALLESTDMDLLAEVLRLLQVMGKRSKFLSTRIPQKEQHALAQRLTAIAQCWGGKLRTVKMAECLKREPKLPMLFPFTYTDAKQRTIIVEQPKFQKDESVGELITRTVAQISPPVSSDSVPSQQFSKEDLYCLLSRVRMLVTFEDWHHRFKCLIVRLLSVSTLVYCRLGGTDETTLSSLLYSGFIEEIVEMLKSDREADTQQDHNLHDAIQTEALSTLCSIVTYEKEPKITQILEALSAGSYHGFLSVMTRQIVDELKSNNLGKTGKPSVSLATALFSFIYHLASIEPGGDTLVGSGLTQTLLSVIGFHELPIECITFGTRCARIIDLFTTIDVTSFKANNGMEICVNRVVHEINECRKEQPFMIDISYDMPFEEEPEPRDDQEAHEEPEDESDERNPVDQEAPVPIEVDAPLPPASPIAAPAPVPVASASTSSDSKIKGGPWEEVQMNGATCHQQRSGLIKGLLTFIKRAIGDVQFQDIMKHLMEGDLPEALMHILSNAEYYSPSLFHQSAHLITNFVYQFPEELSSIQRRHVPYVIFQSLLRKELPNSKDVITTLGNVFTAMCLNERGLRQFKSYDPFNQIFRIVLSVKFLVTLRKKRSAEVFESAQAIGGALDDLMRHYPDLKHDMLKSIIVILDLLDEIGRNPPAGVELVPTLTKTMARSVVFSPNNSSLLPREAREARELRIQQLQREIPEQADERVGGDVEEEPMEVEDAEDSDVDEEDNEMSMDEMSGEAPAPPAAPSPKPTKPFEYGAGMMCEDANGKKILPIGDYMLLIARVVETMMTQSPSQKITEEFIDECVMQKIMKLCHLPCITNEATHATYIGSIANIIKHIVKAGYQSQRNGPDVGPKLMSAIVGEFIKTINPLFEVNNGDFSAMNQAESRKATLLMHLDEKLVEKTLVELNSIIPTLLNLNKSPMSSTYNPQDHRTRIYETWKMPEGMKLYGMLRKLSRMLCWEYELVQTLKPTIRTAATQTEGEMLSDQPADTHLDVEVMPPWDEDSVDEQQKRDEAKEPRWKAAGVSQEEHDFWIKNKPLQDIVSKSHAMVKDLLNSMGKTINVNNPRRPRIRDTPPLPLAASHCISMIFSSIYKDLKWEPPVQNAATSPMAYGRYIELLTQLNHSLFENGRCSNPALPQNFYTSGCHKAFFELFSDKIIPFLGDNMPEGVEQTMEEWCRLAVKLTDRNTIVSSDNWQRRDRQSADFDTNKYLKLVCRDMFNAYKQFFEKMAQMPDWELKSLKKVCENAFSVFKEVAKNLVEETEATTAATEAVNAAAAPAPADAPAAEWGPGALRIPPVAVEPAPAPVAVNPAAAADPHEDTIVMLMDLGFSRDIVLYALESTRNADEAANYLLAHGNEIPLQDAANPFRDDLLNQVLREAGAEMIAGANTPNADEIELQLNAQFAEHQGYELVRIAQRVLRDAGAEQIGLQIMEAYPDESVDVAAEQLINDVMDRVRNPRSSYEENIAQPLIPPLSQLKIEQDVSLNSACKQLFPLVKRLLLVSNDTIHPCAELIVSIFPAMTEEWRKEHLIAEICGEDLKNMAKSLVEQEVDENGRPKQHDVARTMTNRLHFAVLIFDKISEEYVQWIDANGMTEVMLTSLEYLVERFKSVDYYQSLITRIICWNDFYAKTHRLIVRRAYLKSLSPSLVWSYQSYEEDALRRRADYSSGEKKWVPYDAASQKTLNDAFFAGVRGVKCTLKRGVRPNKKVDVDFASMKQGDGTSRENIKAELPPTVEVSIPDLMDAEAKLSWSEDQNDRFLDLSTQILRTGALDPKCSHSMLSFIARLTRSHRNAVRFMEKDGVEAILRLRARCAITYPFLVSIIIRNCIDDDALLGHIYEKTIRGYIAVPTQPPASMSEYAAGKSKDFADTLNFMAPLSTRNPLVFTEAMNKLARMNGSLILPMIKEKKPTLSVSSTAGGASTSSSSAPPPPPPLTSSSSHTVVENNSRAEKIVSMMLSEVLNGEFPTVGQTRMLSQEKILQILAEIVKSYPSLAIIIAETQAEGRSALHSLIDTYIIAPIEKIETTNALKTLIAVISASQNSLKAQELLVLDVKNALASYSEKASELRVDLAKLQLDKESEEREEATTSLKKQETEVLSKISELCSIIIIMCQSCPAHHHHHHSSTDRNNRERSSQNAIMKMFHKKRMCADLVKTIHCLQLSTKVSLDTVNQILKTLDTLLEGSTTTTSATITGPRSLMDIVAGRREQRREAAAGGIMNEREIDTIFQRDGLAFDGEMENLLRRLQGDHWRGNSVQRGAGQVAEEEEGSETYEERERSDSPSESSEHAGDEEVRDDAVETGDGEVDMADAQDAPLAAPDAPPGINLVDEIMQQVQRDVEDDEEDEDGDQNEHEAEEDDHDREDEDDEDDDDDEDEEEEAEDDDQDEDDVRHVEQNPEPLARRLFEEDDDDEEDDDGDEDGDSMEDDVQRLDLDDDYFDMGGPFDAQRMDDMIFPPSFGRPAVTSFADLFRDDFDFLPPYRAERRPLARGSHLGGVISEHPLMTRPPAENDVSRRPNTNIRAEILQMHTRSSLHRQNAIRRTTTEARELEAISRGIRMGELPAGRMLVRGTTTHGDGGVHTSFFDHIFDIRPSNVAFSRSGAYRSYNTGDRDERRDIRASQVPTCLERLESYSLSMEPVSSRFVTVIVNSHLNKIHAAREAQIKKEAEIKAKAKKDAEAAKKAAEDKKKAAEAPAPAPSAEQSDSPASPDAPAPAPEEIGLATPAATNTTNTVSESVAPNASTRGDDTLTTPAAAQVEDQASEDQHIEEEPMEVGEDDGAAEAPQSSAATAASSVAGTEEIEDVERQAVEDHVPEIQDNDDTLPYEGAVEHAPAQAPEENVMPEEFRAILGDIIIPDGVDPAFLAALPEEMRAEVIRDYQRQQRAERASRPVPAAQPVAVNPNAPAGGEAAQGEGQAEQPAAAVVPLVEPIDPVFLNALPPELQEEVLAEHERRLREAEEQQRRQNAPPAPVVEMDGAAVIASLPANERAQVLAEMDDAELAGLPADMQNEARRARAQHVEPNMLRYHRLLFRGGVGGAPGAIGTVRARTNARAAANAGPSVGQNAGNAIQAPPDQPHLLDRESILTLCLLYLVDNNRVPHTRLQKVLRSACVNQTTCDFIVWCLLALLDKASEANTDDEEILSNVPAWLDSIAVSGVGHNERAIRISENAQKISIHSMLAIPMCKNILDLLANIARAYPGNFLPLILRHGAKPTDTPKQAPSFAQFWTMVQNTTKVPKSKDWTATPEQQLEECPLGQMLNSLRKPIMAKSPLKEKVLKVASQIMVTLPMDTLKLLGNDESRKPLAEKLEFVIQVMTTGSCSTEGLADGLTILSEAMRSLSDSTSVDIYEHLFLAVSKLGGELLPQVDRLIVELDEAQKKEEVSSVAPSDQPTSSKTAQLVVDTSAAGRVATGRFDGERLVIDGDQNMRLQMSSCKELQLPAVTVLTDKGGAQYALLSALQTLVKVRNHMKAIRKDKAKRAKDAEKKLKEKETPSTSAPAAPAAPATAPTAPAAPDAPVENNEVPEPAAELEEVNDEEPRISERLSSLESLWNSLSECLLRLGKASDPHAVLALQPAAEAFFLVHASQQNKLKAKDAEAKRKESQAASSSAAAAVASSVSHDGLREDLDPDTAKLIEFAEKHRQVLNQALRQNNAVLSAGGPFAILTQFPKLLDFDVKRKYFRKELTKLEPSNSRMPRYRRNDVSVQVSRNRVFSDSFRELFRLRPSEWKNRFYIIFQGEEGQDAGGLLREWFSVITREIFNPNYALFITAPGDMVTYMINKASYINPEHLDYFKFVGRLIAKSVFEHKYLDCYFTRAFYKHILNLPVRYQDLESEDPAFFKSLDFLLQNPIDDLALDLTFSTEVEEFGVRSVRDLKPNGRKIEVNDANKDEYVKLVCQMKMTGSIRKQLDAFLTGFYEIIPKDLISMFNEQELELLISGLPTVDIDDMAANTDYKGFQKTSTHIQWFWRALRSFEKEDKAKFLQFVTGTSKVPLQGFASLEGMNGVQKFSIHMDSRGGDRLPAAHTCFNQLDLPQYESYEKLRQSLLLAIRECTEGFGFA